ncbi:hypothetical protein BO71DRAFT_147755 [Aspergillus ellipticus CBS 707.79]|uniref:Uncharacterized protein n=1 Tax=Aspergillus ellipticus CBS 707.79 TaxID=1448320 RepID=A0A319CSK9_9EURO|nr:hypothetical protein BO71DRAFT_147755 [Aspergillus ellipticus CBS 707.79]
MDMETDPWLLWFERVCTLSMISLGMLLECTQHFAYALVSLGLALPRSASRHEDRRSLSLDSTTRYTTRLDLTSEGCSRTHRAPTRLYLLPSRPTRRRFWRHPLYQAARYRASTTKTWIASHSLRALPTPPGRTNPVARCALSSGCSLGQSGQTQATLMLALLALFRRSDESTARCRVTRSAV